MAQQSTKPQVPAPSPSPLYIALATAGIIDEVVPEGSQNQILDLTTVSDSDPVPSTSSTPTPYEIFMRKQEKLEHRPSKKIAARTRSRKKPITPIAGRTRINMKKKTKQKKAWL